MSLAAPKTSPEKTARIAPRDRILAAASELFYRHGIRAVGVEAIAEAAETNKMTLYRHFSSKDELVAEYLQRLAEQSRSGWDRREAEHPGDPLGQLRTWLAEMAAHCASVGDRGCAFANAAVELPEKDHPARRVIEAYKSDVGARLARLCAAAGLADPELLADELFLVLEGARVTAQSVGPKGLDERLIRTGEALIKAHMAGAAAAGSASVR
jgi:AcrR family transcriptional regulator